MTTGCSPSSHSILKGALRRAFPLDDRRVAVLAALVLAMLQARSVVLYILKNHVALPGPRETRYQRLRRFVQFDVPDGLFTRFVLGVLPPGELWLILDRTSWKLGQQDVNILLLSATWNRQALGRAARPAAVFAVRAPLASGAGRCSGSTAFSRVPSRGAWRLSLTLLRGPR